MGSEKAFDLAVPKTRLEFKNVTRRFTEAGAGVQGLSFEISAGEIVCLLGPSGSGKSTILRLAAGLEDPDSGEIIIDGKSVAGNGSLLPPEKRGVGLIFQDFALFPHLSVLENVAFGLRRLPREKREAIARNVLGKVNLSHLADAFPNILSGGEQQRVALARALATRPGVMLMDEPFSDLDTQLRDTVRNELVELLRSSGAATILVTHDPEEAMRVADRIILLRDAKIAQVGTPEELYFHPLDREAAAFFGDLNVIHATVAEEKAATPLGTVAAKTFDPGTVVEVLVRPVDVALSSADTHGTHAARVADRRLVGGSCLVELAAKGEGMPAHMVAQVSLDNAPEVGSEVGIMFDPARAHIFPCRKAH